MGECLEKTDSCPDFALSQILPVLDLETEDELQVLHSAFLAPYLVILRADSSLQLSKADATGELEELELGEAVKVKKWISASLWREPESFDQPSCVLLSEQGSLHVSHPWTARVRKINDRQILELSDLAHFAYVAPQLTALPAVLSTDDRQRRAIAKATIAEVLMANIGEAGLELPYLIVCVDRKRTFAPAHKDIGPLVYR